MFHHLPAQEKEPTLREARCVLKPGRSLHMLDFVGSEDAYGFVARLIHSARRLQDNSEGRVIDLMRRAGFAEAKSTGRRAMLFGRRGYYAAAAPAS
jgi:hypothetical protein